MIIKISQLAFQKIKEELNHKSPAKTLFDQDSLDFDLNAKRILEKRFGLTENNYIAKGLFNLVYLKDGLIYKFTRNRSDLLKSVGLNSLKNQVPEKYKKHIMQIEDFGYDKDAKAYYLICENLQPLNQMEKSIFLGNETFHEQNFVSSLLITESNYNRIIDVIVNNLLTKDNLEYIQSLKTVNSLKANLMTKITQRVNELDFGRTDFGKLKKEEKKNKLVDNSRLFSSTIISSIVSFLKDTFRIKLNINFIKAIDEIAKIYLLNNRFPQRHKLKYQHYNRLGKDLLEFLDYLKSHNIFFNDTHTGNIMKRGDDYVLSDVGLFEFE